MAVLKLDPAGISTLMSTELNSLANGSAAVDSSEYDNATNLYPQAGFELVVTFGSAATAGAPVQLYLIYSLDGTNYGDYTTGASPKAPGSAYVGSFYCLSQTANRLTLGPIDLMPAKFKTYVIDQSGQAFPASGSTLNILPYQYESV